MKKDTDLSFFIILISERGEENQGADRYNDSWPGQWKGKMSVLFLRNFDLIMDLPADNARQNIILAPRHSV